MKGGFWLSDEQWQLIKPHLPYRVAGRRQVDDRRVISGIIHVLQAGCRWQDCPEEYGPPPTIYNRYNRWSLAEAFAIEAKEARLAGALAYMARPLTQATMPHSRKEDSTFMRRNGAFSMTITAHPLFGLPYGSYPRLVLAWLTTEAVRTRSPELE